MQSFPDLVVCQLVAQTGLQPLEAISPRASPVGPSRAMAIRVIVVPFMIVQARVPTLDA
jgi:hypothetical protein